MKKILALLLAAIFLLSLVSCGPSLSTGETATETTEETKTETGKKEEIDWSSWKKPQGFTAGFGKVNITPETPVQVDSNPDRTAYYIKTELAITCAAVCDGENIALLFGMDMKRCENGFAEQCQKMIEKKFGIKPEFTFFNATHSHNAPDGFLPNNTTFTKNCHTAVEKAVEDALSDLKPATIYTGTGDTTGFAFVRRYLMEDGSYKGIHSGNTSNKYASHETEADAEIRMIRFDRGEEEKEIILLNWQCHAASDAGSKINGESVVSADFVHYLRETLEVARGAHVGYFNGASGNLNMTSFIRGEQKFNKVDSLGKALAEVVLDEALANETQVNSGKISAGVTEVDCYYQGTTPERVAAANGYKSEEATQGAAYLWEKYQINSLYEANHIQSRNQRQQMIQNGQMEPYEKIPVFGISFGDIGIVGGPYEMFDQNGMEIRAASPCAMTFTCGYTGGSYGYIPTDDAWDHGQYEVYCCHYQKGTGEKLADAMVDLLKAQKAQG